MRRRVAVALAIVILLTVGLVFANRIPRGEDSRAVIYPGAYAITTEGREPNKTVNLPLTLLDTRKNSKRTDPGLFTTDIVSRVDLASGTLENAFQVEITGIEADGEMKHRDKTVYIYNYSVSIPLSCFFVFDDAHLLLSYNDGSTETHYFGDLSLISVPEEITEAHMRKQRALPALSTDTYGMTAFIIEFLVAEELQLESFDFHLPKYGIDRERVVCLEESMDRLEQMYFERTLDSEFVGIYTLPEVKSTNNSLAGVTMKPGANTLVIPFTVLEGAKLSPLGVFGGLLNYSVDGIPCTYLIETIPYIQARPPQMLEVILNDAWH